MRSLLSSSLVLMLSLSCFAADGDGSKPLRAAIARYKAGVALGTRVIGGKKTPLSRNPWQVALLHSADDDNERAQFCGGVLIDRDWLLTAAHCVDNKTREEQVHILSGSERLTGSSAVRTPVESIFVHPGWNSRSYDSDIALIKTKAVITGKAVELTHDAGAPADRVELWISGWGVVDKKMDKPSPVLQGASIRTINWDACNSKLSYNNTLTRTMFCAGIEGPNGGGGTDSCEGDSGGPATVGNVSNARLVGLVSWGEDCALPYKYGVYTTVAVFVPWIESTLKGSPGVASR